MKRYKTLTAGELRKCHGKECRLGMYSGEFCEGKISVNKDGWVYICHNNNGDFDGGTADDKLGYDYSRCIYGGSRLNNYANNCYYNWIEIDLDIKPGDPVGVSSVSQNKADENFKDKKIEYYIGKTKKGIFITEDKHGYIMKREFVTNKEPTTKKVTLELTDEQLEEVKKIIN